MIGLADEGIKKRRKDVLHLLGDQDLDPLHQVFPLSPTFHFLFVSTVCFLSSGTLATCSRKKRRRDIIDDEQRHENEIRISPSVNEDTEDLEETHNLRDPRFLTTCNLKSYLSKLADSYFTGQLSQRPRRQPRSRRRRPSTPWSAPPLASAPPSARTRRKTILLSNHLTDKNSLLFGIE